MGCNHRLSSSPALRKRKCPPRRVGHQLSEQGQPRERRLTVFGRGEGRRGLGTGQGVNRLRRFSERGGGGGVVSLLPRRPPS